MNQIDKITKEFYAQYGFAMNTVQVLESKLLELFALKQYIEKKLSGIEYFAIQAKPMTLGQLKNKLVEYSIFDDSNIELLDKSNKIRRFLAHRFWWDREIEFSDNKKLEALNKEIFYFISVFNEMIDIVMKTISEIRKENNVKIEEEMGLTDFYDRQKFIQNLKSKNENKNSKNK